MQIDQHGRPSVGEKLLRACAALVTAAFIVSACAGAGGRSDPTGAPLEPPAVAITQVDGDAPTAAAAGATATRATATRAATRAAATNTAAAPTPTPAASPTPTSPPTATPTLAPGWARVPAGPQQVPVLMYHHVSDRINTRYSLPVSAFRAQMEYLHDQGYETVSISHLARVIREGGGLPEKAVVITFDDGYLDTYANAFPIMEEFGFTGVAYIITSTFEEGKTYGYMQARELKRLARAGWEIGSHSVTHTNLKETKLGVGGELRRSKAVLEKMLGAPVTSFSYPFAVSTEEIREQVADAGYENAAGVDILVTNTPRRLYFLSRREVARSMSLTAFAALLVPGEDELAWVEEWEAAEENN